MKRDGKDPAGLVHIDRTQTDTLEVISRIRFIHQEPQLLTMLIVTDADPTSPSLGPMTRDDRLSLICPRVVPCRLPVHDELVVHLQPAIVRRVERDHAELGVAPRVRVHRDVRVLDLPVEPVEGLVELVERGRRKLNDRLAAVLWREDGRRVLVAILEIGKSKC